MAEATEGGVVVVWLPAKSGVVVTNSRIEGTHVPKLVFTEAEWAAFVEDVKVGGFDVDALRAEAG